jgi:hypothetical protein
MNKVALRLIALGVAAYASSRCGGVEPTATRLVGQVWRGPVQPVCQVDVPCDEPFSAGFTARDAPGRITTFRSDRQGRFAVLLAPGTYTIIPAPDAPLLSPSQQAKIVTVGPESVTVVRLDFDTGIR